jgi:lipopolysaccharide transport system ATP-binding protein
LLLDEVLAVGDLAFQQKCLTRVEGLVAEGRTVLFVSHSLEAITRFCTRCMWLDAGRVVQVGPVQDVVENYLEEMLGIKSSRSWAGSDTAIEDLPPDQTRPPGDEYAMLLSARVVDANGESTSSVRVDETVGIELEYEIQRDGMNVQPALHFKTPTDEYAFVCAYTDPAHMWTRAAPGRYRAIAWVPPNLLNVGVLYVTVVLVTPDPLVRHCVVERAVSFHVYEGPEPDGTARGLFAREFPGPVRPRLTWETSALRTLARVGD